MTEITWETTEAREPQQLSAVIASDRAAQRAKCGERAISPSRLNSARHRCGLDCGGLLGVSPPARQATTINGIAM